MRFPVFGKSKFSRADMEREAAEELRRALEAVPAPPDAELTSPAFLGGLAAAATQPEPAASEPAPPAPASAGSAPPA